MNLPENEEYDDYSETLQKANKLNPNQQKNLQNNFKDIRQLRSTKSDEELAFEKNLALFQQNTKMKFKSTIKNKKKSKEEHEIYLELDDSLIDMKYL